MTTQPRLGELLLGLEGLALLRLALTDAATSRHTRLEEIRALLQRFDDTPAFAAPVDEPAYDLTEGYRRWSETYDRLGRMFPIEAPVMHALLAPMLPSMILDAACGTGRYSTYLAARGHQIIGVDRFPSHAGAGPHKTPRRRLARGAARPGAPRQCFGGGGGVRAGTDPPPRPRAGADSRRGRATWGALPR